MEKERRVLNMDVTELRVKRSEDGPSSIEGYAAVFDSESEDLGGFVERIAPGAFEGALERSDVRVLFNHDPNHVLGRTRSGTAKISEDDKGLRFEAELPDTQTGRDVAHSIERGDIDGNSFAFTVGDDEWDEDRDVPLRTITEVRELFDVGPVTFPAYSATEVSTRAREHAEKAKEEPEPEPDTDRLEILRKKLELARARAGV